MADLKAFADEIKEMWAEKQEIAELDAAVKHRKAELGRMQASILKKLEAAELDNFKVPEVCTISRVKKFSVRVPKESEAKQQVFDYIKNEKGEDVLFNMMSINSNTLNSFYKEERDLAVERQDADWVFPGIEEPKLYWGLGVRKA